MITCRNFSAAKSEDGLPVQHADAKLEHAEICFSARFTVGAEDGEPEPMSLDRDASDRTFDRQLAYLGLRDDAAPIFREGSSVPGAGVLLALPMATVFDAAGEGSARPRWALMRRARSGQGLSPQVCREVFPISEGCA
jgi:hypothetical protein